MSEINKAINRKIEKEKIIQESFDSLWNDFNLMIRLRKIALNHLKKARLKLSLDVFLVDQNPKIMVRTIKFLFCHFTFSSFFYIYILSNT